MAWWSRWKNTEAFWTCNQWYPNISLQSLYTEMLRSGCFQAGQRPPSIPLFKFGKSSDPSNYRPISVLSALSKSFEKHINTFLHILTKTACGLLHPNQSGFRENHSCHTALTSLANQWFSSINDNMLWCFFVDHDFLLRKLAVYWLSPETLASFLTYRKKTVHVNASTSNVRSLKYGVPQGSVLGPLLFSIYINVLPLFIKACCERFADDTTIHSSNSHLSHYRRVSTVY